MQLSQMTEMNIEENAHVIGTGDVVFARRGKDTHKLLIRTEWSAKQKIE